ncbi:MAG: radical SAM protein [Candidatus Aenigmatarchaeota archaeon]
MLDITNRCIFNCIYCYKKSRDSDILDNNITYLKTEEVIYVARELLKIGFKIVTISGGEPGLHPNLCKIVKEIRDKTKTKSMYKFEWKQRYSQLFEEKNSYQVTMATIKKLKKYRVPFSIHSNITPINYSCVYDLIKFSKKIRAISIRLSHVISFGRGENKNLFLSKTQLDKLFELQFSAEKSLIYQFLLICVITCFR